MSDCQNALITSNLVAALHEKTVEINGVNVETFAEQQRMECDSQGHEVYIEVCGPWPDTLESAGIEEHVALHYVVEAHITGISDKPPADPITEQTKNTGYALRILIMADNQRGGNALITRVDGDPYYFITGTIESPDFVIRLDVVVEKFSLII
jgi:hypothetical protein